ncbi:PucR family transcriptional regulator [Amycolatopsis nigrescens]|uniref:PucR family transcriptional regulator n=1 Tax=Amycolatopsis nigrescens TaxID=381445 RepID=UPI00037BDC29|nr:helix-turn-helix domain-containing protein [Amycolatopsis nigrescens]
MLDPEVPDLGQVLDALGSSLLRPLTALPERPVPVSGVLIFERRTPLPPAHDAILLAVGVGTAEALELVGSAAEAGYACLVVKSFGEPVTELTEAALRSGLVLLAADEAVAWHHLDAMLSSALASAARFAQGPGDPAIGDLFALANAIAGMVGGATAIEDPHRRILAYSTLPGHGIDEGRRQGILGLQVPDAPDHYDEQYRTLAQVRRTCRFPALPGGLPRLGVAVRAGSEVLGSIWVVDAENRLDEASEQALFDAADITALHLLAARAAVDAVRRRRADLLRRLLTDPSSVTAVAPRLGLDPDVPVAVAAFAVASSDADEVVAAHAATRLADLVSLHCEAHYGRPGCALIDGTVYALLPGGPSPNAHRELVADIARRAHGALRVRIQAGLGSLVTGLRSIASSRADADLVLRALTERPGDPEPCQVATIDEMWAGAALSELARILAAHEALPRRLGPAIRAHDLEHGTTYASTIRSYLDANSDIAAASTRLSVHANTIRYRLSRAEEIFGVDLADPDERLVLWLRLRLGDQLG